MVQYKGKVEKSSYDKETQVDNRITRGLEGWAETMTYGAYGP